MYGKVGAKKRGRGYSKKGRRRLSFMRSSIANNRLVKGLGISSQELKYVDVEVGAETNGTLANGWNALNVGSNVVPLSYVATGDKVNQRKNMKICLHSLSVIGSFRFLPSSTVTNGTVAYQEPGCALARLVFVALRNKTAAVPTWTDVFNRDAISALRNDLKDELYTVFYDRMVELNPTSATSYEKNAGESWGPHIGSQGFSRTFRIFRDLLNTPTTYQDVDANFKSTLSNGLYCLIYCQNFYSTGEDWDGIYNSFASVKLSTRVFFYDV